jgi:hypothetical protein
MCFGNENLKFQLWELRIMIFTINKRDKGYNESNLFPHHEFVLKGLPELFIVGINHSLTDSN